MNKLRVGGILLYFFNNNSNENFKEENSVKQRLTPLALSLCLLGLVTLPVSAATNGSSNAALEKKLALLEREVADLRSQLTPTDHAQKSGTSHRHHRSGTHSAHGLTPAEEKTTEEISTIAGRAEASEKRADQSQANISGPSYLPEEGIQYLPMDVDVPGQSFVSTGPYIGVPLQYSGSNLIVNSPSVNQDVALLSLRKNINQRITALGLKPQDEHSHLLLSGTIEGQGIYKNIGGGANSSDIDLTNVGIDAYILGPSSWTSGLISLSYDNNIGAQTGSLSINSRSQNSRVFVNKAFIIVGDFLKSPFYGTLGQMYVPFGTYSSSLVSSTLTKLMFRTQARAALIGFQQQCDNGFLGSAFAFKGDSFVGATSRVNNGGFNLGYFFDRGFLSGRVGGSYLVNVADSQGMQNTGNGAVYVAPAVPLFGGFGGVAGTGNEQLKHRVPGYDVRGTLSIGKSIDLLAEYITAINHFSVADLSVNGRGAKPQALDAEIAYTFQCFPVPTSVTFGYGKTRDALALGMPVQRYSLVLNTSIWRNTLESLEFRHDMNYPSGMVASGSGVLAPRASGKTDNIVTAQFDIYF